METVRFYQRRGLIEVPTRDGGIRRYGPQSVRRLCFIRKSQAAGFTLAEISELLALDATGERARARELASSRITELDWKIAELKRVRALLANLAECGSVGERPCPIIASLEA